MVQATRGGGLIYRDNIRYDPHTLYMEETDMYEGYPHFESLFLCGFALGDAWGEKVRNLPERAEQAESGALFLLQGMWWCTFC